MVMRVDNFADRRCTDPLEFTQDRFSYARRVASIDKDSFFVANDDAHTRLNLFGVRMWGQVPYAFSDLLECPVHAPIVQRDRKTKIAHVFRGHTSYTVANPEEQGRSRDGLERSR